MAALKMLLTTALLCVAALCAPLAAQTIAPADIALLAGSGSAGLSDGMAAQATFLKPSAVAFGADGTVYVADAAAQRIRAITLDGRVRTVAGSGALGYGDLSVPGAFQDGTTANARFNQPSGLAIRSDGAIYVADTFNHCIRLIREGFVSTVAGRCGVLGFADGANGANLLAFPRGLTRCSDENTLYIADHRNGLRFLDSAGSLSTVHVPADVDAKLITGVACVGRYLYLSVNDHIVRYDALSHQSLVAYNASPPLSMNSVQGGAPLGHAYSIAAFSADSVIYGDLLDGAVRYVEDFAPAGFVAQPYPQYVGATPPEDATLGLSEGRFSAPMGIAIDRSSARIAVADAIQRKVFIVRLLDQRHAFNASPRPNGSSANYRVVIEGNYLLWYASGFADSIGGILERRLSAETMNGKRVVVTALHAPCPDARAAVAQGADLVVFLINSYVADCDGVTRFQRDPLLTQSAGEWQTVVRKFFAPVSATLAATHMQAMGVLMPFAWEIAPNEELYRTEAIGYAPATTTPQFAFRPDYVSAEANLLGALDATGFPILDLYPRFRQLERGGHADTLFATEDLEPSARGRDVIASAIAAYLRKVRFQLR